jgi:hypothetical protein
LVLAWKIGFADKYVAPILSHHKHGTSLILMPNSLRRVSTHITYAVAFDRDLYSASVLNLDTVGCFLALHDMRFGPKNIGKPPVDPLSSIQHAQSTSEYVLIREDIDFLNVSGEGIFDVWQDSLDYCPMNCSGSV